MPKLFARAVPLALAALTCACASVPGARESRVDASRELVAVADERHLRIDQYIDAEALAQTPRMALPQVRLDGDAYDEKISDELAALVANNAARALCRELSPYAVLAAVDDEATLDPQVVVTAIMPTSGAASGASSLLGFFVPGPFRLPAGLGGLAVDAQVIDPDGEAVAVMRWARGANAVTNDAKVSAIGDAWQLADRFGREFARALLDTDTKQAGVQRERVDNDVYKANRALCAERFGTVNLAGRGVSIFLPLSPEAIDPGPPVAAVMPEEARESER
jgi:hypothetical protein